MLSMQRVSILLSSVLVLVPLVERIEAAERVYWTDASTRTIQRADLDGSNVEVLVAATGAAPHGITLDLTVGRMYWAEADGLKIRRANLDGSAVEDLVASVGPVGIALDLTHGKMYWTDVFVTGSIQRANLDGSAVETLLARLCDCEGIALDAAGGKMYLTDRSSGIIRRANLDGSGLESLVTTGLTDPRGIVLDVAGGKMYWVEVFTHKVQRANLDGSGVEDLVTGLGAPAGIALDVAGGKMYWTDFGTQKLQRANLDGSGIEDVVTGLAIPVGVALELDPAGLAVAIDIKPGHVPNSINPTTGGVIPVAILTTDTFDAATVDSSTVRFGATGTEAAPVHVALQDVDGDGRVDMILQFDTRSVGIACGQVSASLTGKTSGGQAILGSDSIRTVGCK